eukprot:2104176-Rhodomonas_salina.4
MASNPEARKLALGGRHGEARRCCCRCERKDSCRGDRPPWPGPGRIECGGDTGSNTHLDVGYGRSGALVRVPIDLAAGKARVHCTLTADGPAEALLCTQQPGSASTGNA